MKLEKISIEKFRAIRHSNIQVGLELALVGQNSSGKSSILRALNAFFNFEEERSSFETNRHQFQKTSTAIIEVEFSEVPEALNLPRTALGNDRLRVRLRYKTTPSWQIFNAGEWQTAPLELHTELKKYVQYVYVPLKRDHEISGWGSNGLLKSAVEAWLEQHTSKRDGISPRVAELGETIKKRAFSGLSKHLRKITPLSGDFTFSLDYSKVPDYTALLKDLSLRVSEGGTTVDLEDCGSGTQSMTALALYSYLAELKGTKYILGIEEPEQNLHPQAQREMLSNLRKLPLQVLFTTHSTVLLDELRHHEVVLCRKRTSSTRGIETTTTQLSSTFWLDNNLDEARYYQFHKQKNSDFFFSNFVIITESPIDSEIISNLLHKAGSNPKDFGVSVVCVDGVTSLPHVYHLLNVLKIGFATIVDKDFFIPYLNDQLDSSRDGRGFPKYKKIYKNETLLPVMIPDPAERAALLPLLNSNHSRAMDILEKHRIFCFKWSMEMDLINSTKACEMLYIALNIPEHQRTTRSLLVDKKKAIKKLETIYPVVDALEPANLPNSYKRIRKSIPELIQKALI